MTDHLTVVLGELMGEDKGGSTDEIEDFHFRLDRRR